MLLIVGGVDKHLGARNGSELLQGYCKLALASTFAHKIALGANGCHKWLLGHVHRLSWTYRALVQQ